MGAHVQLFVVTDQVEEMFDEGFPVDLSGRLDQAKDGSKASSCVVLVQPPHDALESGTKAVGPTFVLKHVQIQLVQQTSQVISLKYEGNIYVGLAKRISDPSLDVSQCETNVLPDDSKARLASRVFPPA